MTAHIEAYHRLAFFAFDHGSAHRTRKGGHRAMESSATWQPSMELPNWHSDCLWTSVDLYVDILYCLWYFVDYNDYNKMSTRKPHNIISHKSYRTQTSALRLETRQSVPSVWIASCSSHVESQHFLFAVLGPVVESWKTSGIWDADGFFIWDFWWDSGKPKAFLQLDFNCFGCAEFMALLKPAAFVLKIQVTARAAEWYKARILYSWTVT